MKTILFGASGNIGLAIKNLFLQNKSQIFSIYRNKADINSNNELNWDVFSDSNCDFSALEKFGKFDSVCFAQGLNLNDSIYEFDINNHLELYKANCLYILVSINKLLKQNFLEKSTKICVISSIWQNIARQNKMSYCVTKSALQGLVNSLSIDLAKDGHLINAILPGALDTEMTKNNLTSSQLNFLKNQTNFNRLSNIDDVANLAYFLCSDLNTSITGQFINIDLGFSNAKII